MRVPMRVPVCVPAPWGVSACVRGCLSPRSLVTAHLHSRPTGLITSIAPHLTLQDATSLLAASQVLMLLCNRLDQAGACFRDGMKLLRELQRLQDVVAATPRNNRPATGTGAGGGVAVRAAVT